MENWYNISKKKLNFTHGIFITTVLIRDRILDIIIA